MGQYVKTLRDKSTLTVVKYMSFFCVYYGFTTKKSIVNHGYCSKTMVNIRKC